MSAGTVSFRSRTQRADPGAGFPLIMEAKQNHNVDTRLDEQPCVIHRASHAANLSAAQRDV